MSYRENLIPALNGISFEVSLYLLPFQDLINIIYNFRLHRMKGLEYVEEQVLEKAQ